MMPLIVREEEVTWSQTPDYILIKVPIKGIKANRTNIVTSNEYVRVHFHPFIFETFLWAEVDDEGGNCRIDEGESIIIFEMAKLERGKEWASLAKTDLSRTRKRFIRDRAVELTQQRHAEKRKALQERLHAEKQMVVRDQIRLDGEERERIGSVKAAHSMEALSELDEWREEVGLERWGSAAEQHQESRWDPEAQERHSVGSSSVKSPEDPAKGIQQGVSHSSNHQGDTQSAESQDGSLPEGHGAGKGDPIEENIWSEEDLPQGEGSGRPTHQTPSSQPRGMAPGGGPKIRQGGRIPVTFTPREFPTPSRESTAAEEQEWLKKQAEARRRCGFNDADLRPEERDPVWLLEKGGSLMKAGSYLGAVSAYSHGIKLAPKMAELYVARAEAHLALKNLVKTVEDASQGLELLTPKVAGNARDRLNCHRIRASGFRDLKCYREALLDYREALKLNSEDEGLRKDLEDCEAIVYEMEQRGGESSNDSDSET